MMIKVACYGLFLLEIRNGIISETVSSKFYVISQIEADHKNLNNIRKAMRLLAIYKILMPILARR